MALITKFEKDNREFKSIHPTQVVAKYIVNHSNGKTTLQLNTYGSDTRDIPNKLSQTIQLDEKAAKELITILKENFGD